MPITDASYSPSASTSTEWRMPSRSTNDTVQAAMRRRIAFSEIFANQTMCHLGNKHLTPDERRSHTSGREKKTIFTRLTDPKRSGFLLAQRLLGYCSS